MPQNLNTKRRFSYGEQGKSFRARDSPDNDRLSARSSFDGRGFRRDLFVLGNPTMATVAHYMIAAGIVGGAIAAPPGWIDWFAIPTGTRAKSVGLTHGLGNVLVLVLFIVSWWLRRDAQDFKPDTFALILSFAGAGLSLLTGWLGGELVERLGVSVEDGAHLNSPNSLSGKPASQSE